MPKIIISGCNGRMGQTVARICAEDSRAQVVAGFDLNAGKENSFPVFRHPMEYTGRADAVIDFSGTGALTDLLSCCVARAFPVVLCTTGYSDEQLAQIRQASEKISIFKSANMSLGVNLLAELVKKAVHVLGARFDIEIIERHHNTKVDAPSGTALLLADAANEALPFDAEYVFERQSVRKPRGKQEIGISAIRGGTIVGEHSVIFAGLDEVIELKHTAYSRDVFAAGAVAAAIYLADVKEPGIYTMDHLLGK